ncbi:glycoside hydrolase 57, putative [Babesia ovata]|uniref:Glycoside hydrolase 57, putative n=1 Tax=Babesia ovata TaxID=189622 RepID=A0A2H6K9B6_9APIC|nr:glycoside hydrolase 57, putative [Babesia ovata]GBE59549.1 glycoside hydrolase 57, putative [Babesia ovata]
MKVNLAAVLRAFAIVVLSIALHVQAEEQPGQLRKGRDSSCKSGSNVIPGADSEVATGPSTAPEETQSNEMSTASTDNVNKPDKPMPKFPDGFLGKFLYTFRNDRLIRRVFSSYFNPSQ